jgi:general transcription factor IIIA
LQAHMRKEHSDCMFCGLKFTSQQGLVKHIESQHSGSTLDERKNVVCPHDGCGKRFTKQNNLNTHIRSVHMGERFICGSFDISANPELSSFDDSDGCGKDFVSKVSLVDHIRTAHLGLPSALSAKRKKTTKNEDDFMDDDFMDDEDDEGYTQPRQSKRKARKPKVSKVDQLLGLSYTADPKRNIPCHDPTCPHKFIREYDRQVHMQSAHTFFQEFNPTASAFDGAVQHTLQDSTMGGTGPALSINTEPLQAEAYDQADIDWELQRQALEGGPFWVGADDEASAFQARNEEWTQEQLEMRRLIG